MEESSLSSQINGSTVIHWQELQGGGGGELEQEKRNYLHAHGTLAINAEGASVSSNVRIAITDEAGRSFAPKDAWIQADDGYNRNERALERHYFHTGEGVDAKVEVPAGKFTVEVSQGLEARPFRKIVEVKAGKVAEVDATLAPLDFDGGGEEHWVASDLHVHMNYGGTYRNNRERLIEQGEAKGSK